MHPTDEENNDERTVKPGEDEQAENLVIQITVSPLGEAQLGVNRNEMPVEILHFYLVLMANSLMARHQMNVAQAKMSQESLVLPKNGLIVPR